ncbi:MAG: cystathionine beta-lyase [Pseudomonadota bacterium]
MTKDHRPRGVKTIATHAGRAPFKNHGIVNPPVYHASTVLFETVEQLRKTPGPRDVRYGRYGTPTTFALEDAVAALEGAASSVLVSSGKAAITTALVAFAKSGDHILVADGVYAPTRAFCNGLLKGMGVETSYFDPMIGAGVADLFRPNTTVMVAESPSSITFEVPDSRALTAAARAAGVTSMVDSTWGALINFPAFELGYDVSMHAGTKYVVGHADSMLGLIGCRDDAIGKTVRDAANMLGQCVGPDDCYLALRGLRTMPTRLKAHEAAALRVAEWLSSRPEVARVLHPGLPDNPYHLQFKTDFKGACGLFAIELKPIADAKLVAFLESLKLFGMGYSWGGFESLIVPQDPRPLRTAKPWTDEGPLVRLHIGLEDVDDLIADLQQGFAAMAAA